MTTNTHALHVPSAPPATLEASPAAPKRGRTTISARALNRLVCAVATDFLGVTASTVGAEIIDDRGNLALTVSARIRIVTGADIRPENRVK